MRHQTHGGGRSGKMRKTGFFVTFESLLHKVSRDWTYEKKNSTGSSVKRPWLPDCQTRELVPSPETVSLTLALSHAGAARIRLPAPWQRLGSKPNIDITNSLYEM
jgi:hypothetical protein